MSTRSLGPTGNPPADPAYLFKESGAKRSGLSPRYDLIPTLGHRRLADRFELGLQKYEKDNWKKGLQDPEFRDQVICHMVEHLEHYKNVRSDSGMTVNTDDDLAAIAWGAYVLMEAEATNGPKQDRAGR